MANAPASLVLYATCGLVWLPRAGLAALHAGAVVSIHTAVDEVHAKRLVFTHEMVNDETGVVAARCTLVGVHMDTAARKSCALPDAVVAAARALLPAADAVAR